MNYTCPENLSLQFVLVVNLWFKISAGFDFLLQFVWRFHEYKFLEDILFLFLINSVVN